MLLGYIYKNQLLQQPQDPEEANYYFNLATQSENKSIQKKAHFEMGEYSWIYSENLQKAAEHFDRASELNEDLQSEIIHQAAFLRDSILLKMVDQDVISPSENLRKTQYQHFKNKQTVLTSLKAFLRLTETEPTSPNTKNSSNCSMTCKPK